MLRLQLLTQTNGSALSLCGGKTIKGINDFPPNFSFVVGLCLGCWALFFIGLLTGQLFFFHFQASTRPFGSRCLIKLYFFFFNSCQSHAYLKVAKLELLFYFILKKKKTRSVIFEKKLNLSFRLGRMYVLFLKNKYEDLNFESMPAFFFFLRQPMPASFPPLFFFFYMAYIYTSDFITLTYFYISL